MIGPETPHERIQQLSGRIADLGMMAQQLHLQYGGNRRDTKDADGPTGLTESKAVSLAFKAVRDWAHEDPAGREKPPMFRTARDVAGPRHERPTRQRNRAQRRAAAKRERRAA